MALGRGGGRGEGGSAVTVALSSFRQGRKNNERTVQVSAFAGAAPGLWESVVQPNHPLLRVSLPSSFSPSTKPCTRPGMNIANLRGGGTYGSHLTWLPSIPPFLLVLPTSCFPCPPLPSPLSISFFPFLFLFFFLPVADRRSQGYHRRHPSLSLSPFSRFVPLSLSLSLRAAWREILCSTRSRERRERKEAEGRKKREEASKRGEGEGNA